MRNRQLVKDSVEASEHGDEALDDLTTVALGAHNELPVVPQPEDPR
jgi:hypothetical protein